MSSEMDYENEILLNLKKYTKEYISLKESQLTSEKLNFPQNPVIKQSFILLEHVKERLSHICNHKIVEDVIDIGYDQSKTVYYCEYCETTFGDKRIINNRK
jgi:hypothetical protein